MTRVHRGWRRCLLFSGFGVPGAAEAAKSVRFSREVVCCRHLQHPGEAKASDMVQPSAPGRRGDMVQPYFCKRKSRLVERATWRTRCCLPCAQPSLVDWPKKSEMRDGGVGVGVGVGVGGSIVEECTPSQSIQPRSMQPGRRHPPARPRQPWLKPTPSPVVAG